ncbi:MAG: phage tail sheath subtilisin-like domain-containing protein [Proteobacteria bacterium]|nr:phage tail sheath subtilisin-like domain-containing protein [Pseudomonadota bacterium]
MIPMSNIPSSIRKPGVYGEFNTSMAMQGLPANQQKLLLVGQRLATGAVPANVPTQILSGEDAALFFGRGSVIHRMANAALFANRYAQLYAIGMDDAAGSSSAAGSVKAGGPATSSGLLSIFVGMDQVNVGIASGDSANAIATNILAAMPSYPHLPVAAAIDAADATKVNFTAKNKGTVGNQVNLGYAQTFAAGVTLTVVQMTGGAGDPNLATALANVFAAQFQIIAVATNDSASITALNTHVTNVSSALERRPGIGLFGMTGSLASATTLSGQINSGRIQNKYLRYTGATVCQAMAMEIVAGYGATKASIEDPSQPLDNVVIPGIPPSAVPDRLSRVEQETCLANGVSPLEVGPGNIVKVVRATTTYTLNPAGVPDPALLDVTTICTLDFVRDAMTQRIALRFAGAKISAKTPDRVRDQILDVLLQLERLEMVVGVAQYEKDVVVEKNIQAVGRLDCKIPTPVIPGLHIVAMRFDLIL